jgi:hypothetical protein
MPDAQAEAIAEGFAEETRDVLVTRTYFDMRLQAAREGLEARMDATRERLEAKMEATREGLEAKIEALFWRTMGGVAAMLLVNPAATWGIVAAHR